MRRITHTIWLGTALACLLGAAPLPAHADGWADQAKLCDRALGSYDAARWQAAHQQLIGQDHPAAIAYVLRFYEKQKAYEGEWKNAAGRNLGAMTGDRLRAYYRRLLPRFVNVRSTRYAAERLGDADADIADLMAEALRGNVTVHAVDELLRSKHERAVRAEDDAKIARYRKVLDERLDIRDVALVADLPARDALSAEAQAVNTALDNAGPIHESFVFAAWLARKDDAPTWEVVRDAYHARLQTALEKPALRQLEDLHRAAVALEHRRALAYDLYFHPKKQRQKFDKRASKRKRGDREVTVDLTNNVVSREIRIVTAMRAWLDKRAEGRRLLGTPYHPDLFALNRGRVCTVDTIAFTARDRERQDQRDAILKHNQGLRGVHPKEAKNAAILNAYRAEHGLMPLRLDVDLCVAARRHSAYQRGRGAIAHSFPDRMEPHGVTPQQRMIKAGYPAPYAGGENVLMGWDSPEGAHKAWRGSRAHKRNMLRPFWTEIGVGASGRFWTQNFGTEPYDKDHDADD